MKLAALILAFLFTMQLWSWDVLFVLVHVKHLSGDDYIFQVDFITTKNNPGSKPLTVNEVEKMLPKDNPEDNTHNISELAEIKKDNPDWFIDSQKYLLKKGFTSTYSYRDDKFQRDFTGEITNINSKEKTVSVKFKVSKVHPPLPDTYDDKTIIYHERGLGTEITMREGETRLLSALYNGNIPKPGPSTQRLFSEEKDDKTSK